MEEAIRVRDLSFNHAGEKALRGISFAVSKGTLVGIVGADGAGKSTLFQIMATLLHSESGSVSILGMDVNKDLRHIRAAIGYMPQRFSLYQDLSVWENLKFAAEIMDIPKKEQRLRLDELIAFAHLENAVNRRAGRLSGGMKQKLALCCAIVRKPSLLLLDEPTVGVDPVTRRDFWNMLSHLRSQGITTFVSTPYMDEAELCEEVILLHEGEILGMGSPRDLCADLKDSLWEIQGEKTLHINAGIRVNSPLKFLYTMGGNLHALSLQGMQPNEVLSMVKNICPEATSISLAEPKVEDVLLLALKSRGSFHNV